MISDLETVLRLLPERHEMDSDALSNHIRDNFSGSLLPLIRLEPFVREILRRFKCLPRKPSMDGRYQTIAGHRSFGSGKTDKIGWCQGVLHRSDRTVRYMLGGGNKKRKASKESEETVSALDAAPILKNLTRLVDRLNQEQRMMLAKKLNRIFQALTREKKQ